MLFTNVEMEQAINLLKPFLDRTDIVGYAAARNIRILQSNSIEYFARREELIRKYGEEKDDGEAILSFDSPNWDSFEEEMKEWALISHDVDVFKIPIKESACVLSGNDILSLWWMFEEDDE